MKIPSLLPTPNLYPLTKDEVIAVAKRWHNPGKIKINEDKIKQLDLSHIKPGMEFGMTSSPLAALPWDGRIELALAVNSINHKFWDKIDDQFIRYEHQGVVGATGMRNAFEAAWFDEQSALGQRRLHGRVITAQDIQDIFGDIPDPELRADILNEVISPRLTDISEKLAQKIDQNQSLDVADANLLASAFPSGFADDVLKKAQLAISEVWVAALERQKVCQVDLTAFADYQIPNVLRALGVLEYSPTLAQKIDNQELIPEGSGDELALRGAAILAVEKMAKHFNLPVAAVDHYLWTQRKISPYHFHLTDTTLY